MIDDDPSQLASVTYVLAPFLILTIYAVSGEPLIDGNVHTI
jgi:hypothetical protein